MSVADAKAMRGDIDAAHVKNLFLRDKKRSFFLLTVGEDVAIDLKTLRHELGAKGGLGFASADRLREVLGLEPGAVSPLGLLNDEAALVDFYLDRRVAAAARIAVHPLTNDQTVVMATTALRTLIESEGHPVNLIDV